MIYRNKTSGKLVKLLGVSKSGHWVTIQHEAGTGHMSTVAAKYFYKHYEPVKED